MDPGQHLNRRLVAAGRQTFGIVTRSQLLGMGLTERQIDYRLRCGALWPTFRSAYSVGVPAASWRSIWMAAVLACGPQAMLAGPSGAALWGLTDMRPSRIDVNRPSGNNRTELSRSTSGWALQLNVRCRSNCPATPALAGGIPVLPVPELLVDLAADSTPSQLEAYVSAASQKGYLDETVVARLTRKGAGRKGIERLRYQLRYWDEEMRNALSILETKFISVCKSRGIEIPKANRWICDLKVDFVWLDRKLVVEVDGYAYHKDRVAFERDHERQAILVRGGYLRLAFTWRQVVDRPDEVVEAVLAALGAWKV